MVWNPLQPFIFVSYPSQLGISLGLDNQCGQSVVVQHTLTSTFVHEAVNQNVGAHCSFHPEKTNRSSCWFIKIGSKTHPRTSTPFRVNTITTAWKTILLSPAKGHFFSRAAIHRLTQLESFTCRKSFNIIKTIKDIPFTYTSGLRIIKFFSKLQSWHHKNEYKRNLQTA